MPPWEKYQNTGKPWEKYSQGKDLSETTGLQPKQINPEWEGVKAGFGAITDPLVKQDNPIMQALARSSTLPIGYQQTPQMGKIPSLTFPVPGFMSNPQVNARMFAGETSPLALASTMLGAMGLKGQGIGKSDIETGIKSLQSKPPIIPPENELAGNLVNSLIKPLHKQYSFGKNPGLGVAKEGISDTTLGGLKTQVDNRIGELNNAIKEVRTSADYVDKTVDARSALNPFSNALSKLIKGKNVHKAEIERISNIMKDVVGLQDIPLDELSIKDAYELKNLIKSMQSWKTESEGGKMVNSALKEAYHNIDTAIDKAVPPLAQLNDRMANMISASQAIEHRIEVLRNIEPSAIGQLVDIPFKAFKSPAVKTGLAKFLADKYPILLGK